MSEIDEAELLGAGQRGAVLDGVADGRKRIVQAAVLRRCCHELKDQIDARGLRLTVRAGPDRPAACWSAHRCVDAGRLRSSGARGAEPVAKSLA